MKNCAKEKANEFDCVKIAVLRLKVNEKHSIIYKIFNLFEFQTFFFVIERLNCKNINTQLTLFEYNNVHGIQGVSHKVSEPQGSDRGDQNQQKVV